MVSGKAKKELARIFGKRLKEDLSHRIAYSFDATRISYPPELVAFPLKTKEISLAVKTAAEYKFPIIARGSGTGFSGGAVPVEGGLVLSFSKMRSLEIRKQEMIGIVEPGVITEELQHEAEKYGLFYPPDPASLKNSTIGGNLAENAGGPRCLKYGVTKNYVLGLEVVLPDGEVISIGRGLQKNVAGYDLISLFVGSEGTLGIITKAYLRLVPKPPIARSIRVDFKNVRDASTAATAVLYSGILPSALEFMDKESLKAAGEYLGKDISADASLLIQIDGDEKSVNSQLKRIAKVLKEYRPIDILVSTSDEEEEMVWKLRRSISSAISKLKPIKVNEDIVVPRGKIPDAVDFIYQLAGKQSIDVIVFGHMGDGNIHVNFMIEKEQSESASGAVEELFKWVIEQGGSISGEHGIGITKAKYLESQLGERQTQLMREIKRLLDPHNIMNPGKIFS